MIIDTMIIEKTNIEQDAQSDEQFNGEAQGTETEGDENLLGFSPAPICALCKHFQKRAGEYFCAVNEKSKDTSLRGCPSYVSKIPKGL